LLGQQAKLLTLKRKGRELIAVLGIEDISQRYILIRPSNLGQRRLGRRSKGRQKVNDLSVADPEHHPRS